MMFWSNMPVMKLHSIFLVVIWLSIATNAVLAEQTPSYNILMLAPFSPRSHRSLFTALANGLTHRGHKVTLLSSYYPPDNNLGITYVKLDMPYGLVDTINYFSEGSTLEGVFDAFEIRSRKAANDFYDDPKVKELYNSRHRFDVAIVDQMFSEAAYALLDGLPFITMSTSIIDPVHSAMMGNLLNPAYIPNMVAEYPRPYSFIHRLHNIYMTFLVPYLFYTHLEVICQEEISKRFPELPSIHEIKKNQSMTFLNSHVSFSTPVPLLPNQVEIGGIHIRPKQPLPQEIEEFVHGPTPVVYMSLGSMASSKHMPQDVLRMFLSAFRKLPYKFMWKFEKPIHDLPENVLMWEWFPQQDILGHPNVKVFVSHGGLLGSQEAIYHSTPMLFLPLFGDQAKDATILQNAGVGRTLSWTHLTEEIIIETIQVLMNNPSYREKISQMSSIYRDQRETPLERAVFWTEYVVRHRGALHLRSPEHALSWVAILHLDMVLVIYIAAYFSYRLMRKVLSKLFSRKLNTLKNKDG